MVWHGSCMLERPAWSRSAGRLAASADVPGAAEQLISLVPEERGNASIVLQVSLSCGISVTTLDETVY